MTWHTDDGRFEVIDCFLRLFYLEKVDEINQFY